jgi:predicted membrane metal-binding protein
MSKITKKDKLLYAVDTARKAFIQKRPILEELTEDKDMGEIIKTNLERSYQQRYNPHIAQLHWISKSIKYYKEKKNLEPSKIRQYLGITRQQYYLAQSVYKAIKNPEAIPYLENISPRDFRLTEKELDYVKYGAWPEYYDPEEEDLK